jgi:hypothetical protein
MSAVDRKGHLTTWGTASQFYEPLHWLVRKIRGAAE